MGKRKQRAVREIQHVPFMCLSCGAMLDNLTDGDIKVKPIRNGATESTAVTVCVFCGTIYESVASVEAIRRGEPAKWNPMSAERVPPDVKAFADSLRRAVGMMPKPTAS